jgi:hypothetical protein
MKVLASATPLANTTFTPQYFVQQSVDIIAKREIVPVISVIAYDVVPGSVELPDDSDCISFLTYACVSGSWDSTGCV